MMAQEARTFDPANTRRVIVNSDMVRREILDHFQFPADRIHLVRNGVEVERFQNGKRAATRARFGVKDDEFLLLFVGSGWERKGLSFLLRLMVDLDRVQTITVQRSSPVARKRVKLLVVGKGKKPAGVSQGVIFAGPMSDVENALAAADLFTFLPIYEPSANVVAEALAAGLPVVTSSQNGASELITEGVNGSVVGNPADPAAVFAAVSFWLESQPRRPVKTGADLSLNRNVAETLAVLELAAREKAA
jgi:UDP-glucose:(heptosyl)LPS alpha-1,3-glucosyltransferase